MSAALMRTGYRGAYWAFQVYAWAVHPSTRGVKCILLDERGRALFVRHHYGNRRHWELPGGGAHGDEDPLAAATREAWEELGAEVPEWRDLGTAVGYWHGKDERLTVVSAPWPGGRVRPDPVEIAHFHWFRLDDPPAPVGPATVAALEVVRSAGA